MQRTPNCCSIARWDDSITPFLLTAITQHFGIRAQHSLSSVLSSPSNLCGLALQLQSVRHKCCALQCHHQWPSMQWIEGERTCRPLYTHEHWHSWGYLAHTNASLWRRNMIKCWINDLEMRTLNLQPQLHSEGASHPLLGTLCCKFASRKELVPHRKEGVGEDALKITFLGVLKFPLNLLNSPISYYKTWCNKTV